MENNNQFYLKFHQIGTIKLIDDKKIFICQDGTEFQIAEKRYDCNLFDQLGVWDIIPVTVRDGEIVRYQVKGLVSSEIDSGDEICSAKGIITEINRKDVVSIVIKNPPNPKINVCFSGKDPKMKTNHIWEIRAVRSLRKLVPVDCQRWDTNVQANKNSSIAADETKNIKTVDSELKGDYTLEVIASDSQGMLIYIQSEFINNNPLWKYLKGQKSLALKAKWLNDNIVISPQRLSNGSSNVENLSLDDIIPSTNEELTPACSNCLHYQADICTNPRSPVFASKVNTNDRCPEFNCV